MEKEFIHKTSLIATLFLFFVLSLITLKPEVTGFFLFEGVNPSQIGIGMITMAVILFIFIFINKGNSKEILKNIIGAVAIYIGIYAVTKIIPSMDLLIGTLSLTFGIMAIIWGWKAKNAFSKGSSLRDFTSAFFSCLVSILLFSLFDTALAIFNLNGIWVYGKYALITIAYINFVYAAHKMRGLSSVFGFSEQGKKITNAIKRKNPKKSTKAL